jgi:hypothetical protein
MTTASSPTPSIVTVPLGYSAGSQAVSEALRAARVLWSDANIASYRLTIAEDLNYWSAGCRWNNVISDGVVTGSEVDPSSTSSGCMPNESTVEQLHEMISYWLDSVSEFADPEFGEHTLNVEFDEFGVPVAMEYDLANGADEESSMRVKFTPSATSASPSTTSSSGGETTGGLDGPVVFAAPAVAGEEALGVGTVEQVGDCLMLAGSTPDELRRVIVWQFGTSWNEGDGTVILPDGAALPIGSTFSAGGGFHGSDDLGMFLTSPEAAERVRQCAEYESSDNVFVIQHQVEVAP